ncbi:unnamed protein product [Euphydryas editha]|uniref:Uncharacterized protein n=1 Tax=Euphydryas editha TaxID=104508 RepID=A0AAU9U006_EUPED|nr:unnamed protein product [Euphydryas editha]
MNTVCKTCIQTQGDMDDGQMNRAGIDQQEARQSARRPEVLSVSRTSRNMLAPPQLSTAPRTPQDVPPRSRKCSIVREEEDDEESAGGAGGARAADARRGSRSEGRLHLARPAQLADNLIKVNLDEDARITDPSAETVTVTSAATAENARRAPPAPAPARRQRLECRRRRARAGSCSSSDLSDDDSEKKKRTGEQAAAPAERARRDSHDDSSDSQERAARRPAPRPPPAAPAATAHGQYHARYSQLRGGSSSGGSGGGGGGAGGGAAGDARGGSAGGRRRRAARKESRLRESRSLNRIAEVEEAHAQAAAARWAGAGGLVALCGRPLLRLLAAARPAPSARRLHGLC